MLGMVSKQVAAAFVVAATIALGLIATPTAAWAATCPASLSGSCSTTDPGDGSVPYTGFVDIDNATLTFLAVLNPANQGNGSGGAIPTIVNTFLSANGFSGVTYLGRQDGSGGPAGTSVTTTSTDGGNSGLWSFNPGTTGLQGQFILIHAGGGQSNVLYQIKTPGDSGNWDTSENLVGNNNNQGALSNFDLFDGNAVPLPGALPLFATGIGGLGLLGWRRKRKQAAAIATA